MYNMMFDTAICVVTPLYSQPMCATFPLLAACPACPQGLLSLQVPLCSSCSPHAWLMLHMHGCCCNARHTLQHHPASPTDCCTWPRPDRHTEQSFRSTSPISLMCHHPAVGELAESLADALAYGLAYISAVTVNTTAYLTYMLFYQEHSEKAHRNSQQSHATTPTGLLLHRPIPGSPAPTRYCCSQGHAPQMLFPQSDKFSKPSCCASKLPCSAVHAPAGAQSTTIRHRLLLLRVRCTQLLRLRLRLLPSVAQPHNTRFWSPHCCSCND